MGIFILAQIIALGSIFWLRKTVVKVEVIGPTYRAQESLGLSKLNQSASAAKLPDLKNLPAPQVAGRLQVPHPEGNEDRILQFNDQAREFRRRNDFDLAETALKKALDLDPCYPNTLINFAMLEEARGHDEMALDYWQRVVNLGDQAGAALRLARERASILEDNLQKEKIAREREDLILKASRKLLVDEVISSPAPIGPTPEQLTMDFKIRSLAENLSPGKMRIQIFFYEKLANGDLVPAKIEAKFLNERPTWSHHQMETLRVRYSRSQQQRDGQRDYHGYLIRLIYDGEVQDERSSPVNLLKLFPYQPK
ncbi:MAG: tetratricopeptide repeat protein [Verrucomicrobiota bacterium]